MKIWIKLYTEALHDRKMRKLNRFDKSVFFDLLLLAGYEDNNGYLPEIDDIALELDLKSNEAEKSVTNLLKVGLLTKDNNGDLLVTNFQKRQDTNLTPAEKMQRYRAKLQASNNEVTTVTDMLPDCNKKVTVDIDIDKEIEIDKEKEIEIDKAKTPVKAKPTKHKHGTYQHVLLTDDEYRKLCERFPQDDAERRIQNLDDYLQQHADKHYSDHYLTIIKWSQKDDSQKAKIAPVQQKKSYTFQEVGEMMRNGELTL